MPKLMLIAFVLNEKTTSVLGIRKDGCMSKSIIYNDDDVYYLQ